MAKNLRMKVPKEDTVTVFDVNKASAEALRAELGEGVKVANDVREVAEQSVSYHHTPVVFAFFAFKPSLKGVFL